jgi:quinoprotein dehydrogenase-associated probable ABC transporter substrate-binding protein
LSSRFEWSLLIVLTAFPLFAAERPLLRVCSDPNNLPFSNDRREGFENRIAELAARDLGMKVSYYWWAQRRGFVRKTLGAGRCDVIIGVPRSFERTLVTRPYYRSSYVFVSRRDRRLDITSLDDPRLRTLKVGVEIIGDDYTNSPPAHALANRGIVRNVSGFMVYRDYSKRDPPPGIIEAVERGQVDVSAVWGPTAGYFIRHSRVPLTAVPIMPAGDRSGLPLDFEISMGVRRGDTILRDRLDAFLQRRRNEIDAILREYGVPRRQSPGGPRP